MRTRSTATSVYSKMITGRKIPNGIRNVLHFRLPEGVPNVFRTRALLEGANKASTSSTHACPSTQLKVRRVNDERLEGPYRGAVGGLLWIVNMTQEDSPSMKISCSISKDQCWILQWIVHMPPVPSMPPWTLQVRLFPHPSRRNITDIGELSRLRKC